LRSRDLTFQSTYRMKIGDKLKQMQTDGRALLAVNFYNFETLKGIMIAARKLNQPVILQLTRSSIEYMGLAIAKNLAKNCTEEYGVEAWLHLDHGDSIELVKRCLDAGFDSVMIDASEKELSQNIEITSTVVQLAKPYKAHVEAELGYVAKLGQPGEKKGFTDPTEAREFVESTGVNALAVAIGTAHGFYKEPPLLRIELLRLIKNVVGIPLVLHGSSGVPESQVKEAISNGICKVNIATEVKDMFMGTLRSRLSSTSDIDLRNVFPPAIEAVTDLLTKKFLIVKMD